MVVWITKIFTVRFSSVMFLSYFLCPNCLLSDPLLKPLKSSSTLLSTEMEFVRLNLRQHYNINNQPDAAMIVC